MLILLAQNGILQAEEKSGGSTETEEGNLFYSPSVVKVLTVTPNQAPMGWTGVVVNPEGLVLTSSNCISIGPSLQYQVQASKGGKYYPAKLLGSDPLSGIAALRVEGAELAFAKKADSDSMEVGIPVTAVGLGPDFGQVRSAGVITALGQKRVGLIPGGFENFIEMDVAIDELKAGGPLMDLKGRWIGINFQPARERAMHMQSSNGYAIPAAMALEIAGKLIKGGGSFGRGFLGVLLQEIVDDVADDSDEENRAGVVVANVSEGTPAMKAGLLKGDVILDLDGDSVLAIADLRLAISNKAPGSEVKFLILREEKETIIPVKLGELPDRN